MTMMLVGHGLGMGETLRSVERQRTSWQVSGLSWENNSVKAVAGLLHPADISFF